MALSPRGGVPSRGFRTLALLAVAVAFALVIVGGVVRVSDSGLGCGPAGSGTEGWPLCGGRLIPLIDTTMIVEYAHRALAGVLVILIGALALLARARYRERHVLVRLCATALGLVVFQAVLGGLTVEKGLEEWLVAAHLGVAMLQLGVLTAIAFLSSSAGASAAPVPKKERRVRLLAPLASLAVLATIVAGGYMAASERHGTTAATHAEVPGTASGTGPHGACGREFPTCDGGFLPFGRSRTIDIQLTHRVLSYVAFALVLVLLAAALRARRRLAPGVGRPLTRAAGASAAVLAVQVLLGALNVWLGEHAWLVVAHLATGTLLWSSLLYLSLPVLGIPQEDEDAAPARSGAATRGLPATALSRLGGAAPIGSDH